MRANPARPLSSWRTSRRLSSRSWLPASSSSAGVPSGTWAVWSRQSRRSKRGSRGRAAHARRSRWRCDSSGRASRCGTSGATVPSNGRERRSISRTTSVPTRRAPRWGWRSPCSQDRRPRACTMRDRPRVEPGARGTGRSSSTRQATWRAAITTSGGQPPARALSPRRSKRPVTSAYERASSSSLTCAHHELHTLGDLTTAIARFASSFASRRRSASFSRERAGIWRLRSPRPEATVRPAWSWFSRTPARPRPATALSWASSRPSAIGSPAVRSPRSRLSRSAHPSPPRWTPSSPRPRPGQLWTSAERRLGSSTHRYPSWRARCPNHKGFTASPGATPSRWRSCSWPPPTCGREAWSSPS